MKVFPVILVALVLAAVSLPVVALGVAIIALTLALLSFRVVMKQTSHLESFVDEQRARLDDLAKQIGTSASD